MLSTDRADSARANLRELYCQGPGQLCGFLPDATPFTREKINVRDGHYQVWGPVHFYTTVSGGVPAPGPTALLNLVSSPRTDPALLAAVIDAGFIPSCAMKVNRSTEMGPISSYNPPFNCGCYFEQRTNGANACKTCNGPIDCPAATPACNLGYCEVQ